MNYTNVIILEPIVYNDVRRYSIDSDEELNKRSNRRYRTRDRDERRHEHLFLCVYICRIFSQLTNFCCCCLFLSKVGCCFKCCKSIQSCIFCPC